MRRLVQALRRGFERGVVRHLWGFGYAVLGAGLWVGIVLSIVWRAEYAAVMLGVPLSLAVAYLAGHLAADPPEDAGVRRIAARVRGLGRVAGWTGSGER